MDVKEIAETIQAAVLSVATIVGGIWAAYRFRSLGELDKARLDLLNSSASLSKAQGEYETLRRALEHRGTLNLSIAGSAYADPRAGGLYVVISATFGNVGNRTERVEWQRGRLHIAPVVPPDGTSAGFGDWTEVSLVRFSGDLDKAFAPGSTSYATFVLPVPSPGSYFVRLMIPGSAQAVAEAARDVGQEVEKTEWYADTVVLVDPTHLRC